MKTFLASLLLMAIVLLSGSCNQKRNEVDVVETESASNNNVAVLSDEQTKTIGLTTTSLEPKEIEKTIHLNGKIFVSPEHLTTISSVLGGHIKSVKVLPGSLFKKGDILAIVEDQQLIELQKEFLITQAQLKSVGLNYNRQKELNQNKATSDKAFQEVEATYNTLLATRSALEQKLKMVQINPSQLTSNNVKSSVDIRAPFSGIISEVKVNRGQYVTPSDALFELINPEGLLVKLTVFENDLQGVKVGQNLLVYSNQNSDKKTGATVVSKTPKIGEDGGSEIIARLSDNSQEMISGLYVNGILPLQNYIAESLPSTSVVSYENKNYVFEALGDNKFLMTAVEIGVEDKGFIEILNKESIRNKKIVDEGAYSILMALKNKAEE